MNYPNFFHEFSMKDYGDAAMTAFEWLGMTGLSADDLLLNYKLYDSFDNYERMDKCRLSFPNYDEVHLAFKSKMKEVHPDKGGTTELAKRSITRGPSSNMMQE